MNVGAAPLDDALIESKLCALLAQRGADASCCPSEVARALAPGNEGLWRSLMPRIREVTAGLVRSGRVVITRGSQQLTPDHLEGGPIRIRRGRNF